MLHRKLTTLSRAAIGDCSEIQDLAFVCRQNEARLDRRTQRSFEFLKIVLLPAGIKAIERGLIKRFAATNQDTKNSSTLYARGARSKLLS
jgi:hypothetical protein